jgi:hypothetical protein
MLLQLSEIREIQFLFCLTDIILGTQLAIFFFYRYHKINVERLQLNKILLSYGSICLFNVISAFILTINRFIISSPYIMELLNRIGYVLLFLSIITFLYFITTKEYSKIINLKVLKVLIILNLIPIILIILIPSNTLFFSFLKILLISLNLLLIATFQIKLIIKSKGKTKKYLIQLFIGGIFSFSSLFFIIEICFNLLYLAEILTSLLLLGTLSFIVGFITLLSGIFGFPAFFELNWEENLINLFIINQNNNNCLFKYNFSEIYQEGRILKEKNKDFQKRFEDLFLGGITGIDRIIAEITNTKNGKINKIKREDSLVFLEYGSNFSSNITYALITKKDLNSNLYFLKSLKKKFEYIFKEALIDVEDFEEKVQLFKNFDVIIDDLLLYKVLK